MKFTVEGEFKVTVAKTIEAESMEGAIVTGKELRISDFVEFRGIWANGDDVDIVSVIKECD